MRQDVIIEGRELTLDVSLMKMPEIKAYIKSFCHIMGIMDWNILMWLKGDFIDTTFGGRYGFDIDFHGYDPEGQHCKLGTKYFRADYKYLDLKKGVKFIHKTWVDDPDSEREFDGHFEGGNSDDDYKYYHRTGIVKPHECTWQKDGHGYAYLNVKERYCD